MSDPTLEDDSLISQDDIDKLLNSSSIEEAEEKLSADDDSDDLGELSQDDIDSLLNSNAETSDDVPPAAEDGDDGMELISQDDIDSLMNAPAGDDASPSKEGDTDADDTGELSQDDIDSLMNGTAGNAPESDEDVPDDSDEDLEMISRDDVKNLMGDNDQKEDAPEEDTAGPAESLSGENENAGEKAPSNDEDTGQEDPAAVLPGNEDSREPVPEDAGVPADQGDWIIDESEAVTAEESIVTQETLDDLIAGFDPLPDPEAVRLDDDPDAGAEDAADSAPDTEPDDEAGAEAGPVDGDDSEDPADALEDADVTVLDFDDDNEDVTQEDIDALLLETDDDDDDDDILISQDDIDTLLMAADEEDEDVLGDLMDDADISMDEDLEDEDIIESEAEAGDAAEDQDQVVLEGDDEPVKKKAPKKQQKQDAAPGWYTSKLVIACASALLLLGITVPAAYFVFFSGEPEPVAHTVPMPERSPVADMQNQAAYNSVEVTVEQPDIRVSGNLILKDFVVLAPVSAKEVSYVSADISIDYSDQRAYHEIQNNLSFYRDLIYESIKKRLDVTREQQEVTEADILMGIETTLKKVLPGRYIDRVSFKSFKIS